MRFIAKFINARMPFYLRQTVITRTIDCGYQPQFNKFNIYTRYINQRQIPFGVVQYRKLFVYYSYGAAT